MVIFVQTGGVHRRFSTWRLESGVPPVDVGQGRIEEHCPPVALALKEARKACPDGPALFVSARDAVLHFTWTADRSRDSAGKSIQIEFAWVFPYRDLRKAFVMWELLAFPGSGDHPLEAGLDLFAEAPTPSSLGDALFKLQDEANSPTMTAALDHVLLFETGRLQVSGLPRFLSKLRFTLTAPGEQMAGQSREQRASQAAGLVPLACVHAGARMLLWWRDCAIHLSLELFERPSF